MACKVKTKCQDDGESAPLKIMMAMVVNDVEDNRLLDEFVLDK
jgi:hypothetical protein